MQKNDLNCNFYSNVLYYTLQIAGLFQPKFGSNMDKPKCWEFGRGKVLSSH